MAIARLRLPPTRRLWRPADTSHLLAGLALAIVLPLIAAWLASDVWVFDRFPSLPFLTATVLAALVGRLSAGLVATLWACVLVVSSRIPPLRQLDVGDAQDLAEIMLFLGVSLIVAYALAVKDIAREDAERARSEIQRLARELAGERNTMQQILQEMPGAVMIADAGGRLSFANRRAQEVLDHGFEPGSPLTAYSDVVPWTARRSDGNAYGPSEFPLARALETGEVIVGEMMTIEWADGGARRILEADAAPIVGPGEGGRILGAVTVFQDVTEHMETQSRLKRATERLSHIQTVTDVALSGLSFDDLATQLLRKLRIVLGTDSATLLVVDRSGQALVEHSTVGATTDGPGMPVPIGAGIAGTIASTLSPLVVIDVRAHGSERPWLTRTMRSLMGVPLVYRGKVTGVIHVATKHEREFTADDVELIELAASRIASALERASLYDSRSAMSAALQRSLVPGSLPSIAGLDIAGLYRPFAPGEEIGGDFYGVFPHGQDSWGVVVGDVSGKGAEAAAIMGLAAHSIGALARYESRPSVVLGTLNELLLQAESVASERFCTACEMRLRAGPDRLRITVCSAGHPLPFVVRRDGRVEQVGTPGTLLGAFDDPVLRDVTVDLERGEAIVAYTDGLVERRGVGIDVGEQRLCDLLGGCARLPADEIVRAIETRMVDDVVLEDDVALVVITKR